MFSLKREFEKLSKNYNNLIFETYIPGKEIQVAVMGGKSIGAIELRPKDDFMITKLSIKNQQKLST